jgi:hypothetical protein
MGNDPNKPEDPSNPNPNPNQPKPQPPNQPPR